MDVAKPLKHHMGTYSDPVYKGICLGAVPVLCVLRHPWGSGVTEPKAQTYVQLMYANTH